MPKTPDTDAPVPAPPTVAEKNTSSRPGVWGSINHEYGQYVATRLLYLSGVPAIAAGAAVPASHPCLQAWLADGGAVPVKG